MGEHVGPQRMKQESGVPKTFLYAFLVILISVGAYYYLSYHPKPTTHSFPTVNPPKTTKPQAKPQAKKPKTSASPEKEGGNRLFTGEELKQFRGGDKPSYLSILGEVYDVSSKPQHYGPDGGYHFFTGRDASRAFTTGEFNEKGLREDLQGLSLAQVVSIWEWLGTYREDYPRVGFLVGHWYDEEGKPTDALQKAYKRYQRGLDKQKEESVEKQSTPPCNMEWTPQARTISCADGSGGVNRGWAGVIRKLYRKSDKSLQCVCVHPSNPEKDTQKYRTYEEDGCPAMAKSCTWDAKNKLISNKLEEDD